MNAVEVTLPGGISARGDWHRTARLRPLSGRDEAFLCEEGQFLLPAQRTTALLARSLDRLGPIEPVTYETVSALTVGDRDALLLHLRRITLGEKMDCVLSCPDRSCREKMDLDLNVSDLLLPPYPYNETIHETIVEGEEQAYLVRFRLPSGADQETVAAAALEDEEAAAGLVLQRCVEQVIVRGNGDQPLKRLPEAVIRKLPEVMFELDPQAEIRLCMACPACGAPFDVLLDAADFLLSEIAAKRDDLYREVHFLAFHYHWSEADILGLTKKKRRLYIELLIDAIKARRAK